MLELSARVARGGIVTSGSGYNAFPSGYITVGWEQRILIVVAAAALLALFAFATRYAWLRWLLAVGLVAYIGIGEWLGTPSILGLPWLATGVAVLLTALLINGWRQTQYLWTLPPLLWLAFAPFASTYLSARLALSGGYLLAWIAPRLGQLDSDGKRSLAWASKIALLALWDRKPWQVVPDDEDWSENRGRRDPKNFQGCLNDHYELEASLNDA